MTMQFKKGDLRAKIVVSAEAWAKSERAASANRIRINHLNMASKRVVARLEADGDAPKPGWFCLRVMTGRETAVEKLLADADVESLVVMTNECKVVKRGRVRIIAPRPVIRGYVLVRCCPIPAAMMGLLEVDDVIDVVGGAIRPYRADADSISRFKRMAEEGKYDAEAKKQQSFELQEQVRVTEGPFASFDAIVTAIDDEKGMVSVEVNIFGRSTPVHMHLDQIEKI